MALLSAEQILAAPERTYQEVYVPEWGGTVRLQSLTGKERDRFEESLSVRKNGKKVENYENARAKLIAACAVDENGKPLFQKYQVDQLGEKAVAPLARLFDICRAMNGMSNEDLEELIGDFDPKEEAAAPSSTALLPISEA